MAQIRKKIALVVTLAEYKAIGRAAKAEGMARGELIRSKLQGTDLVFEEIVNRRRLGRSACLACERQSSAKGLCRKHYARWDSVGRPNLKRWIAAGAPTAADMRPKKPPPVPKPLPHVPGKKPPVPCLACPDKRVSKGLCGKHYTRWRIAGQPEMGPWVKVQRKLEAR